MLLDTSGLFCYFDASETRHHDAVTYFYTAPARLVHSDVLAEFTPFARSVASIESERWPSWRTSSITPRSTSSGLTSISIAPHSRSCRRDPTRPIHFVTLSVSC